VKGGDAVVCEFVMLNEVVEKVFPHLALSNRDRQDHAAALGPNVMREPKILHRQDSSSARRTR